MEKKPYFLAVVGPTASGKSNIAIALAKQFNGVIISMDSMQIYKHFNIGTAKITNEDQNGVQHEMLDIIELNQRYSVDQYVRDVKLLIQKYNAQNQLPILVGGTALYLKSLLQNFSFANVHADESYRNELYALANSSEGKEHLHQMLKKVDPASAYKLHKNDVRRVVRALEVYKNTGILFSSQTDQYSENYCYCVIGLELERSKLYEQINQRVDYMIQNGLIQEINTLLLMGADVNSQAMQSIGYKELLPYIDGSCSLDTAIDKIKQNSRHYAKRQLTFFRSFPFVHWVNIFNNANYYQDILQIIKQSDIKEYINEL